MTQSRLRVRLLVVAATCVLALGALELASLVLFRVVDGRSFSYARIAREQAAEGAASDPPRVASLRGPDATSPAELVPHPFMGFVYDPESGRLRLQRGRAPTELTEQGFFRIPKPDGAGDALSVAVFGGSVAAFVAGDGREALGRALAANPALRGRPVHLECFALGGFKQPQMATGLAYLLALGHRFDVVIELDGLNEVALSFAEYKFKGGFPFYPREWDRLVGQAPDLQDQRRVGGVAYLQGWRGRLAHRFARPPLSWSVTAALVWRCLDRWLAGELGRARQDLATAPRREASYRERGPRRQYANDQELLRDIARVWGLSSVQMQRLCAGARTRYYHFLQPNQYVPGSKPMGASERALAYRADHPYRSPVEQGYPMLRAEGARLGTLGVEFRDLSGLFETVRDPLYIDDCCHMNPKGTEMLAEAIGTVVSTGWSRLPAFPSSGPGRVGEQP